MRCIDPFASLLKYLHATLIMWAQTVILVARRVLRHSPTLQKVGTTLVETLSDIIHYIILLRGLPVRFKVPKVVNIHATVGVS